MAASALLQAAEARFELALETIGAALKGRSAQRGALGVGGAMLYRLDELATLAGDLGLDVRRVGADRVDLILQDAVLAFINYPEQSDSLVGFDGTGWHAHGVVHFGVGDRSYIECDELDILLGLTTGELLIVSEFVDGRLSNRWLTHRKEPVSVRHIRSGEELRITRLPETKRGS